MFDLSTVESENTGYKPLKAGIDVPVKLESVDYAVLKDGTVTEDLVFKFKGIAAGNTGTFDFKLWANVFDSNDLKFQAKKVDWAIAQIKHIAAAYLPEEVVNKLSGKNWTEFSGKVIKALNPKVTAIPAQLKVLLDGKNRPSFPLFPDFIVTQLTPDRVLALNTKINPNTGMPYERIEPIAITTTSNLDDVLGGSDSMPTPDFVLPTSEDEEPF